MPVGKNDAMSRPVNTSYLKSVCLFIELLENSRILYK